MTIHKKYNRLNVTTHNTIYYIRAGASYTFVLLLVILIHTNTTTHRYIIFFGKLGKIEKKRPAY